VLSKKKVDRITPVLQRTGKEVSHPESCSKSIMSRELCFDSKIQAHNWKECSHYMHNNRSLLQWMD